MFIYVSLAWIFYLPIYLSERHRNERDVHIDEEIAHLLIDSSNARNSEDLASSKPGLRGDPAA